MFDADRCPARHTIHNICHSTAPWTPVMIPLDILADIIVASSNFPAALLTHRGVSTCITRDQFRNMTIKHFENIVVVERSYRAGLTGCPMLCDHYVSNDSAPRRIILGAMHGNHFDMCVELIHMVTCDLRDVLASAAYLGHQGVCEAIVAKGGTLNLSAALARAAASGHRELCGFFIERGANRLNEALHYAAERGDVEICELLLREAKNRPLDYMRAIWAAEVMVTSMMHRSEFQISWDRTYDMRSRILACRDTEAQLERYRIIIRMLVARHSADMQYNYSAMF